MADVYSTVFIASHNPGGVVTYTTPQGAVAIVRDIDVYINGDVTATTYYVTDVTTSGTFAWASSPAEGLPGLYSWRGRQVFEEGEAFAFHPGGNCDVRISGYLLASP